MPSCDSEAVSTVSEGEGRNWGCTGDGRKWGSLWGGRDLGYFRGTWRCLLELGWAHTLCLRTEAWDEVSSEIRWGLRHLSWRVAWKLL